MTRLHVGEKMPDFTFNTVFENNKHIHDYYGKKTLYWVLRYIGCPLCRLDIHEINERYDEFKAKDANVVIVIQSDQAHVKADLEKTQEVIGFDIVCDNEMKIYEALEIRPAESKEAMLGEDREKAAPKMARVKAAGYQHGEYEGNEQQLPAVFVTDAEGTVTYAHYAKSLVDLPTIDEALELL